MIYKFKVFLDCQSFCSQGTVPIRDTLLIASFHVPRWHLGLGYMFSVCDTLFWWEKTVSRAGNRGKTYHFVRDTDFCAEKGVSRHETRPDDRNTASDTQFHAEKGVSLQGKVVGKERRLVNLGCREADLARGEDRGKQRQE